MYGSLFVGSNTKAKGHVYIWPSIISRDAFSFK